MIRDIIKGCAQTTLLCVHLWWQAGVMCLGLPETMNRPLFETMEALEADGDTASTSQSEPLKEDTYLKN